MSVENAFTFKCELLKTYISAEIAKYNKNSKVVSSYFWRMRDDLGSLTIQTNRIGIVLRIEESELSDPIDECKLDGSQNVQIKNVIDDLAKVNNIMMILPNKCHNRGWSIFYQNGEHYQLIVDIENRLVSIMCNANPMKDYCVDSFLLYSTNFDTITQKDMADIKTVLKKRIPKIVSYIGSHAFHKPARTMLSNMIQTFNSTLIV